MNQVQRVEELNVENVKGIKHVVISSKHEDVVMIEGGNGEGKSSAMDALKAALGAKIPTKNTVRKGEERARVIAKLSEMTVTKTWTKEGKSRIEVISNDGARYSNPMNMLHELVGELPFDPTALMMKSSKEAMDLFLSLVDSDQDFNEMEKRKKNVYAERTGINRLKKSVDAKRKAYPESHPDVPQEELLISELSNQLTIALATEDQHKQDITLLARNERLIETKRDMVNSLMKEINNIGRENEDLETSISNYQDPGTKHIQGQISNAEDINKKVRYMKEKEELDNEYRQLNSKSESLSNELKEIQATKEWELQNAKLPIEGLSFNEDELTYHGLPLSECSTAEKMKACVAICIGLHRNPNGVKVMFIEHGNQLDEDNLAELCRLCTAHDYQLWIEMVTKEPSGMGFFIEEGELK